MFIHTFDARAKLVGMTEEVIYTSPITYLAEPTMQRNSHSHHYRALE